MTVMNEKVMCNNGVCQITMATIIIIVIMKYEISNGVITIN
jgi:hypothetical protein